MFLNPEIRIAFKRKIKKEKEGEKQKKKHERQRIPQDCTNEREFVQSCERETHETKLIFKVTQGINQRQILNTEIRRISVDVKETGTVINKT